MQEIPEFMFGAKAAKTLPKLLKYGKYAASRTGALKYLDKTKLLANKGVTVFGSEITPKVIAFEFGETMSGGIEGQSDFREEALRSGLTGDDVIAMQIREGAISAATDRFNPAEQAAFLKERKLWLKSKIGDYAAGKISKMDLMKETGAGIVLNGLKSWGKESFSESVLQPIASNVDKELANKNMGGSYQSEDITPRTMATNALISMVPALAFSTPTSIRYSKSDIVKDAINKLFENPELIEQYYKGRRASQGGNALDREEYLKSVFDQVNESGLVKEDKSKAATLIIDRQNASLELDELTKKYGANAPLTLKKQKEMFALEKEIDTLFSGQVPNDVVTPIAGESKPTEKEAVVDREGPVSHSDLKAYDFDGTLFDHTTGQLTDLGKKVKQRIDSGEQITILTARKDTDTAQIRKEMGDKANIVATGDEKLNKVEKEFGEVLRREKELIGNMRRMEDN